MKVIIITLYFTGNRSWVQLLYLVWPNSIFNDNQLFKS